jgi:hypothetical protein
VCRSPLRLGGKLLRRDANGNLFGTTLNGAAITDVDFYRRRFRGTQRIARNGRMPSWDAPPPSPKGNAERKPRAAPSGDRKPSKNAEIDAAAARGVMPPKPIMTSPTNKAQYQPRFDKLEAMATTGDWDGVRGYEVKGINSYAKMVKQYRDRLLTAHAASTSSEAA